MTVPGINKYITDEDGWDDEYYLAMNPDVAAAVECGEWPNGEAHFAAFGHKENRKFRPPNETAELGGGVFPQSTFRYPYAGYDRLPAFGFAVPSVGHDDIEVARRLISAWHHARAIDTPQNLVDTSGMWSLPNQWNPTLFAALDNRKPDIVASLLSNMFQRQLTHGIAMGRATAYMARHAPRQFQVQAGDRMLRLAEAVGAIGVRSPEQGDIRAPLNIDVDQIVAAIESQLRMPLAISQVGGMFGIQLKTGILPDISFTHIYAAHLIRSHVKDHDTIFELGGGFGGLAYFLHKMVKRPYTIFDLPTSSLIQAYFLLKSDVADEVSLVGEQPKTIRILPWPMIREQHRFDIAINQDSLPEMPPHIGGYYTRRIREITRRTFISINQEQAAINASELRQTVVPKMMKESHNLDPASRNLFWLRDGYVWEVYSLNGEIP